MGSRKITQEEFIERAQKIHIDENGNPKYDYSLVKYINSDLKVKILCKKHGVFEQVSHQHIGMKQGCSKCSKNRKLTTEEFIEKSNIVHDFKFYYNLVNYVNAHTKVEIICPKHGLFEQSPNSHMKGHDCHKCGIETGALNQSDTTENFIEKAKAIHGDKYDYSLVKYINAITKVIIICQACKLENGCGEFLQSPNKHTSSHQGCTNCSDSTRLTNEKFIKKATKVHGDKYDYSKVLCVRNDEKVIIICKKHGEFMQAPYSHIDAECGCKECGQEEMKNKQKSKLEDVIEKFKNIHGDDYDYSLITEHKNYHTLVKIICKKCNTIFEQTPGSHSNNTNKSGCPKCNCSKGEKSVEKFLIKNNLTYKHQKRFKECRNINTLPFDFYLPELNTCIEYDGELHYKSIEYFGGEENLKSIQLRDAIKTNYCLNNNIKLIRIKYTENVEQKLIQELLNVIS